VSNNYWSRRTIGKWLLGLLLGLIILTPIIIVDAGQRGVLIRLGKVQQPVLEEGLHLMMPLIERVKILSIRVQKEESSAEASSKDLQDVFTDVALNWHIIPAEVNLIYQQIGNQENIVDRVIRPAVEEVLKAAMAQYTAEEIITKRGAVKAAVDALLSKRLAYYHIVVDDIFLVHVHFSERFSEAVEAKQVAEQDAKRAEFIAIKAVQEAEAMVNLARGEAEAQRLIRQTLNPQLLQKQALDKWDGKLPEIMGENHLNLNRLLKVD
jgi:regulator of protease activity HflC (stomatin/prohibitin superfamily)